MKKTFIFFFYFSFIFTLNSCRSGVSNSENILRDYKVQKTLYFNPEIYPEFEEIKEPTYAAFYSAVSDRTARFRNYKMLRVDSYIPFDSTDTKTITEFCINNNAQYAIVPKVKYFKVGLGKYVFSNQVIVSLRIYDAEGKFITESKYDTYRKNARLLGSAENSIKIGTVGAMKKLDKNLRIAKKDWQTPIEN